VERQSKLLSGLSSYALSLVRPSIPKTSSKSKKRDFENEGFIAGFKPSSTPFRTKAPPAAATDMTDIVERDIVSFDDDEIILLDGQFGRSVPTSLHHDDYYLANCGYYRLVKPTFKVIEHGLSSGEF
jgi:hypothetical protein